MAPVVQPPIALPASQVLIRPRDKLVAVEVMKRREVELSPLMVALVAAPPKEAPRSAVQQAELRLKPPVAIRSFVAQVALVLPMGKTPLSRRVAELGLKPPPVDKPWLEAACAGPPTARTRL